MSRDSKGFSSLTGFRKTRRDVSAKGAMRNQFNAILLIALYGFLVAGQPVFAQHPRNLLSGTHPLEDVQSMLLPAQKWHPFPKAGERTKWTALNPTVRNAYIAGAERFLHGEWATPKATIFLEYVRTGDRSHYQEISFGRREQLAALVLGECVEGKGRFLDDIVNGIWTICEESYWGVPAHLGLQKRGPGLPDVAEPTVDLFAAETGALLAWTSYLLKDSLDRISPLICERITQEVERRILRPNLERDDFWWMGFSRTVNNWNPWICSNWLPAALLLERDTQKRIHAVHKILRVLDNLLNEYPADGGCDEGPSYWSRAGGSVFDCLELLASATDGKLVVYREPLIKAIGRYIADVYIHGEYFVNFADAAAKHQADASTIFRFGRALNDSTMIRFGAFLAEQQQLGQVTIPTRFGVLGRALPALFSLDEMLRTTPAEPLERDFWYPHLQVMGARSVAGSWRGFYLAAKGGHNAESHNHNDIGNFIVYSNGEPVIIDVGVETYTAKTFSSERYSIWTMQSAYHNLPTINGVMQKDGKDFRAADVHYAANDTSATFALDIAHAYPVEAAVQRWQRSITLHRGNRVSVREEYSLKEKKSEFSWTLMTSRLPRVDPDGRIRLINPADDQAHHDCLVSYDAGKFSAAIEPIAITDERLRSSWGEKIYQILLRSRNAPLNDVFSVEIVESASPDR